MKATEFLIERWTKKTVDNYFDNKQEPDFNRKDIKVSQPFDGCVLLKYNTVPDVARSFFRVAEYYDGKHYGGSSRSVSLVDLLDHWMDRDGDVDYFKFWDGFNITDLLQKFSGEPLGECFLIRSPEELKHWEDLKFSKESLLPTTPRIDKSSPTL